MYKKCRSGAAGIKRSLIQNMEKRSFLEKTLFPCFKYARAGAYFCHPAKFLAKKNVATSKRGLKISPPLFYKKESPFVRNCELPIKELDL